MNFCQADGQRAFGRRRDTDLRNHGIRPRWVGDEIVYPVEMTTRVARVFEQEVGGMVELVSCQRYLQPRNRQQGKPDAAPASFSSC